MNQETLDNNFKYHKPSEADIISHTGVRNSGWYFAKEIFFLCPDSQEKSLALTKVEEAVMWANAAIARNK